MLQKFDRDTLAATIAQAVVTALSNLEQPTKPAPPVQESATINPVAFGEATGYGLKRVRDLLAAGRIKHVRSGRRILIPRAEIQAFLERESVGGAEK